MQSIAGLAAVLQKFTVEPATVSVRYPKANPSSSFVQSIKGGVPLTLKRRCVV